MGNDYQILYMILCTIFMLIASLNAATYFSVPSLQENHHVRQISGEDENKGLILEKLRAFLGLKSNNLRKEHDFGYGSISPSPIEAPSPAPVLPRHVNPHHFRRHRPRVRAPIRKIHKEKRDQGGVGTRTLVAVLVSATATFVLFGIGLIWGCKKFRKRRRSRSTMAIIHSTEEGNSQNAVKKVNSDPEPDLFYHDSIGATLEAQEFSPKQTSQTVKSEKEVVKSDSDSVGCSNVGEIVSVNENQELIKYDKVTTEETHSSDNESFHSLYNSHSSNARLSNASAGTLGDTSEILSSFVSNVPMNLPFTPPNHVLNSLSHSPHPPPPPPPLPHTHISTSHSASCSKKLTYKASSSSTLPNLSSMNSSDSSCGSNQTPRSDLPPLKAPLGIPPPPCPPPFTKGPPPPPSQLPQYTPLGKEGVPLPKLKPLHWDKVRAAPDQSMVWDKLRSSSFEFDEEMIESLFGYNMNSSLKKDEGKSKSPSPKKHVLEPKRLQNITILSKALNATAEQVCDALMQGAGLCLEQLEALIKMELTKEEEAKLTNYKGDMNELGSAEKLVKATLNIPFAFLRIEAMLYRETFEDEIFHLKKSFSILEEACKELRSSRLFLKLLEAVLKTGNRMNVGTIRGGAKAFKLDALLKLADVKGTDGKTTLLHFVVQEIIRSEGIKVSESIIGKINQKSSSKNVQDKEEAYKKMGLDLVSGLTTELFNVKRTATIDLDVIANSVSNLSNGMNKLQHLVQKDLSKEEKSGNFVQSMKSFLNYAEKNLKELQEDEHRVLLHVREITEYFHGNLSKDEANPLRIFVIVRDFLGMLDHVCKELRSLKGASTRNPLAPFR